MILTLSVYIIISDFKAVFNTLFKIYIACEVLSFSMANIFRCHC